MKPRCPCSRPSVLLSRASRNTEGFCEGRVVIVILPGTFAAVTSWHALRAGPIPGPRPLDILNARLKLDAPCPQCRHPLRGSEHSWRRGPRGPGGRAGAATQRLSAWSPWWSRKSHLGGPPPHCSDPSPPCAPRPAASFVPQETPAVSSTGRGQGPRLDAVSLSGLRQPSGSAPASGHRGVSRLRPRSLCADRFSQPRGRGGRRRHRSPGGRAVRDRTRWAVAWARRTPRVSGAGGAVVTRPQGVSQGPHL